MGEIRRIVGRKKYAFSILVLFCINLCLFQYSQMEVLQMLDEPESREMILQVWEEDAEAEKTAFYEKLQGMEERVNSMLEIRVFADEESFSYKNILKTKADFKELADVEIVPERDRGVESVLEYGELHWIAFIIIMIFVLSFFDERKAGLWQIVYTCKKGRLSLAVKRLGCILTMSIFTSFAMIVSTLLLSFYDYGGLNILNCPAQSVKILQDFTMTLSVREFLLYYMMTSAVSLFAEGLFVWGVLSLIHNFNMGVIVTVLIYGIESVLFFMLSPQNPLCILKYLNLYCWLNPTGIFTEYVNFPLGSLIFNQREFTHVVLIVSVIVFSFGVLWIQMVTRPFYVPGLLERKTEQVFTLIRRALCRLNGIGYECYKCLIQGRGLAVIAIFAYILFSNMTVNEVLVSPGQELLNDFYAENTGEINGAAQLEYERIRTELEAVQSEWESAAGKGGFIEEEAENKYRSYEADRNRFRKLEEQLSYGKKLEKRGISGWFLNKKGFEKLLGEENMVRRLFSGVLAAVALILILSPVFSSEWQCGIGKILRCTKKGRVTVFTRKYVCVALFVFVISGIIFATELFGIMVNYPLQGLSAPVQNIPLLERFPFHWNVAIFIIVWFLCRTLVLAAIAVLCLCVSVFSERVERTYLYSLLLVPLALLSGGSEYMILGADRILKTCVIVGSALAAVVIGVACCWRVWVRGKQKG